MLVLDRLQLSLTSLLLIKIKFPTMDAPKDQPEQEWASVSEWYACNDQFDFDNVAVSHMLTEGVKLLACADCERGPIGVFLFTRSPPLFVVSGDRVNLE